MWWRNSPPEWLTRVMPNDFVDWIYWKLGSKVAEDYMIPYNQKMFSKELNQLGTYWLEKLPNVSFEETLLSWKKGILDRKMGRERGWKVGWWRKELMGWGLFRLSLFM